MATKDVKQLEKELEELNKDSEKLKKELEAARTGVVVDGQSLKYLENGARIFLDEYKRLAATLTEENQEKLGFGNNKYQITIAIGRLNHLTIFSFAPTFKRANPGYIISDELVVATLIPQAPPLPTINPQNCFRLDVKDGPHHILFGTSDPKDLTEEFIKKQVKDFFDTDIKRYLK